MASPATVPFARELACAHCGLAVPRGRVAPDRERSFCCSGCETVWGVLHEHGLERYYDLRDRAPVVRDALANVGSRTYREFDDAAFHELFVRADSGGLLRTELYLEGVHCAACVWLVEKVPVVIPGVAQARVDLRRQTATVTWDPGATTLSAIARFLDSLGYPAHPFRGIALAEVRGREDRALLARIAVAGFSAGNVMLMAFALYGAQLHGMEPEYRRLFEWGSLLVALPSILWSAQVFYRGAWASLRTRALHMDVPVTLGILAGSLWGAWRVFTGGGDVYFDSVTALILLLLAGRWVQRVQQRRAADAAELLYALTPSAARRIENGLAVEVPLAVLAAGDRVEVRAGDSVPADGVILEGRSDLDRSLLTGESRPAAVGPGDRVHAGTVNRSSRLVVEVETTGEDTRVGRLMRLVEEAGRRRAPVVRAADRLASSFVAVVLALAAITAVVWWWIEPARAVDHAVALLVVTCPCALGLATPLAVSAAIGRAGRLGILVKGGDVVERLSRPGTLILDKTGTLTEGRTRLIAWHGDEDCRRPLAALESHVHHPIARAMVDAEGELPAAEIEVLEAQGGGVRGVVDGRELAAGSVRWTEERFGALPEWAARHVAGAGRQGRTPVVVVSGGTVAAVAEFGDRVRPGAADTVARLTREGWTVTIESGDHSDVVHAVAAEVGIDRDRARGERLPEDKLDAVRAALSGGPVVMVGDGVNDAAALSGATVGVAVHGGAEAAMAAADVYLSRQGLAPLETLLDGSRRTLRVIRRNLALSLVYNALGATLAMAGWISPLTAAILMPLSSLTVIGSSYRSRTFEEGRP